MTEIKSVVFDLGNVIIESRPRRAVEELAQLSGQAAERVANLPDVQLIWEGLADSRVSEEDFFRSLEMTLGIQDRAAILDAVVSELGPVDETMVGLVQALSQRFQVACLSNTIGMHWEHMRQHTPIFSIFPNRFASHELRLRKPDRQIYDTVADALGCPASAIFFLDDREENVSGALAAGWKAHLFRTQHEAEQAMKEAGIVW